MPARRGIAETDEMSSADIYRLARGKLTRLAQSGLDSFTFRERAISALRSTVGFDAAWWWTIDPASLLFTSGVFEPLPADHSICGGLHTNEFGDRDVNKFRVLARRPGNVGVLSAATGGDLRRSERYQRLLTPLGYQHELRLAQCDDAALWGGLALLREQGTPDFTPAEARRIASLGPTLTEGLRLGIAFGSVPVDCVPEGPGLLIVDDNLKVLTATANARRWLAELPDDWAGLPDAVRSVVGRVRDLRNGENSEFRVPRVRVRGTSGRWLAIYASQAEETGSAAASTAVIIQEARPAEIAPLIIQAYGLSPREARVTRLVLQGHSTGQIATAVHLSPYTVQDHLKAVFGKVGVRSRRELVATLFDQYQWPRFGMGDHAPEADGAIAGSYAAEGALA